jgi:DnaJ family protein C protein 3
VHKTLRSLQKDTTKARNFVEASQWRQAIKVLDGPDGLLVKFETAYEDATGREGVLAQRVPTQSKTKSQARLDLYSLAVKAGVGANDFSKRTNKWSEIVLAMDEDNVDALVAKGERLLKDEGWDEAVRTLSRAFELTGNSSQDVSFLRVQKSWLTEQVMNRLTRAQKLQKVSKQKDYYKVLGVPRDADDRTIKKALYVLSLA